ncbi:methyltransferase family protein [Roseivirga ehrenbergii]|uniref:Methyltransferase type 11 domain-containing protein n=1 Tax=Roseivirga ehrenbergii (strain DSM 102268 / JCM 13514 / KCTC 12282 / NCIMB 14502 / KMM 6017) TaxID=279360 RepID=A0A150X7Z6_ROSEK|nr:class I SAM-dependent methyltransferase [Roseivirga ehrenbergii]KYG74813.1 hypothetical protein MB14_06305 [Roseivirga ehrenbergii]TCL13854.1 methyltransferase family protein [Roseivirga ehrenbergii]
MKFTGERLTSHVNEYYTYEHLHRYYFAMDFIQNKCVLDVASGEGYGVSLMANLAQHVIGVDIEKEAITHAQNTYQKENIVFVEGDIRSLPFENGSFDIITCFETIEHITEHDQAMGELKRVLRPNGALLISTPDSDSTHELASRGRNPFHPLELNKKQFASLLNNHFENVSFLYQKTINASLIMTEETTDTALQEYRGSFSDYNQINPVSNAQYFIGICTDSEMVNTLKNSVLTYSSTHKSLLEKILFKLRNLLK